MTKIDEIRSAKDVGMWLLDQLLHGLYITAALLPIHFMPTIVGVCVSGVVILGIREVEQARKASKDEGWYGFVEELLEIDRIVDVAAGTLLAAAAAVAWL